MEKVTIPYDDWVQDLALEVTMNDSKSFVRCIGNLERMGVLSYKEKTLYQSCHILAKDDKYYIVHFKELFALDGRPVDLSEEDTKRRNLIAKLLEEWDIITIVDEYWKDNCAHPSSIRIIKYADKDQYTLVTKYRISKHTNRRTDND